MRKLPIITIALCALCTGLMLLPPRIHELLYYDSTAIATGNLWGLLSAHLIHADVSHWFWNTLALAVLGGFIETRSPKLLAYSLLAGIVSVDMLLLSPVAEINRYCGLSGVFLLPRGLLEPQVFLKLFSIFRKFPVWEGACEKVDTFSGKQSKKQFQF